MNRVGSRWWALAAITLALLAASLDVTVLSVALPTLAGDLRASEAQLQWFSSGYALVLAAAMLPAGLLGDRYGRKKVLIGGLVLFGIGSVACAYSPSPEAFIAARVLLGLAGAAMIVMALSVITVLFDEAERPRAIAVWGAANFLALPIGPLLGGWMLNNFWWGLVFLVNAPIAFVGLLAVVALVPESRAPKRPGIDVVGVASSSGGLALVTYGFIEAGENGWGDASAIIPMAAGIVALVAFLAWEGFLTRRADGQPLIDLYLFRSASFTWGVALVAIGVMAMIGVMFTMPQYFAAILGADAQGSGLRLLPLIVGLVIGVGAANRVAPRIGVKVTVAGGFAVLAAAMLIGSTTTVASGDAFIAGWTALAGAGMGIAFVTAATGAVVELPAERAGVGAALIQAVQKLGAPFGAAILGSVLNAGYQAHVTLAGLPAAAADAVEKSVFGGLAVAHQLGSAGLGGSVRAAFVAGMDDSLRVSAGIAIVGIVLALAFMPRRAGATAGEAGRQARGVAVAG